MILYALCMVLHTMLGTRLVPAERWGRYRAADKDRAYYIAHGLFYGIPLTWLLFPVFAPIWMQAAGCVLFFIGSSLYLLALKTNPFFLPTIQPPPFRVTMGVYGIFDHPGYVGMSLIATGALLMLGHALGVIPWMLYLSVLLGRARVENKILKAL